MGEISLSTTEFKALSSESRTKMLKLLGERNHTLSELAAKTEMAATTVKQHAEILVDSGLIELRDEGRKWKYYALTRKGRELLSAKPNQTNILIVLSTSAVIILAGLAFMFNGLYFQQSVGAGMDSGASQKYLVPAPEMDGTALQSTAAGANAANQCITAFFLDEETSDYAQNCYSKETKEECEQVDYFNEQERSYGLGDGKPDCRWANPE